MLSTRLVAGLVCALIGGCDGCTADEHAPASTAAQVLAPVPAPSGLIAKLVVPAPGRTLAGLRDAAGGPTMLLPRSVGGFAASMFGLPLQAVEHFDENLAVVAAATDSHAAIAFHIRDPASVMAACTKGADAKFTTEKQADAIFLVPTDKSIRKPRIDATLAVVDHYLVAADSREGVTALGLYLTRTLAHDKSAVGDVVLDVEKAGVGELSRVMFAGLAQAAKGMDLPAHIRGLVDLDDTLETLHETLGELGAGRVSLALDATALVVTADLAASDTISAKPLADPLALVTLPDDVLLAASWSESASRLTAAAAERTRTIEELTKTLGETWTSEDAETLRAALSGLAEGRGEASTMGLRCTGMGLTGLARGSVRDRAKLDGALDALIGLRSHEAVSQKLIDANITLSANKTRILEVPDDVWRIRLKPKPKKKGEIVEEIDLLGQVRETDYVVAAGMETVDTLQLLHAPIDERSLASKKPIVDALTRSQTEVGAAQWITVMIDPQAIHACAVGKPGGTLATPLVFAIAPQGNRVRARLEVARALLRVAAKELTAF